MLFPIVGPARWTDDFGDPRPQGHHEGNDILSDWRAPVVAVEPGKIEFWTTSRTAGCMLYLFGKSGTTYLYIHLNNDRGPKNDGRAGCKPGVSYAPGLRDGAHVRAGELIGYVGSSGDAGATNHLHFELHPNDGAAVSPFRALEHAERLLFVLSSAERAAALAAGAETLTLTGTVGEEDDAAAGASLTVAVEHVELSSGQTFDVERDVTLRVPEDATVERQRKKRARPAALATADPGETVTVTTTPVELTLEAKLAPPGTLAAASILLGGTTPAQESARRPR